MALCPRIDPLRPPALPRNQPGLLKYGATCMPGTATAGGCSDDQKFWTILIPWDKVTGPEGWTAPGGNRYWASSMPVNLRDPAVVAIFKLMASRSKMHTDNVFKNWDEYRNLKMSEVLTKTRGKLATSYGVVHVEIQPDPNETAAHFAARGGYLLWVDPETGVFTSHQPIDWYKPSWLPSNVDTCQLFAYYNLSTNRVEYSVRVEYKGTWEKVVEGTLGKISGIVDDFCTSISGEKATAIAVTAGLYPGAQAYVAAWGAARGLCYQRMAPPEPCEPRPDQAPIAPTLNPLGWKAQTASGSSSGALIPSSVLAPGALAPAPPPTPQYPEGTIAWFDTDANGFRIAVPQPGPGVTHAVLSAAALPKIPPGISLVTRGEWEKATLPFWRRSSTKTGTMIAGVAVAVVATVYVGHASK